MFVVNLCLTNIINLCLTAPITDTHNLCKSEPPLSRTKSQTHQTHIITTNPTHNYHTSQIHIKNHKHVERKSGLSFIAESKSLEKKLIVWKRKRETKKEGTNHKPMQRGSWVWAVWWKGSFRRRSLQSVKEKERDREAERKREMQRMSERPGKREWERKRGKKKT